MTRLLSITSAALLLAAQLCAQDQIRVDTPSGGRFGFLTRPYTPRSVPPVRLANSSRFDALIRGGNLYLTAADVVALAVENNIDVEVQRYGPLLAREVLRRAQAGGALRSVGAGISPGPTSVSLQGVSLNTGGLSGGGTGVGSGGGIVTQLGPQILSLDPSFLTFVNFQHATTPQSNTVLTGTTALVQTSRSIQAQYSQNWIYGTSASLTYASNRVKVNSALFSINPFTNGSLDLQITQNLLQGFGPAVNGRNIRVQRNNLKVTDLQFKQQVITTVSAVLNLYWDLVAFDEDVRARRQQLAAAEQLLSDNKRQVELGSLAEIEVTRAESQVYASRQDLTIAQTNQLQQETILKNALSRNGVTTSELATVHIVPLDKISMPAAEALNNADELNSQALQSRPEIEQARLNLQSNETNLAGIKSSLRPSLQAFVDLTNNGLTGDLTGLGLLQPGLAYLGGGYTNLLGQIFRRNYPSYSAGFSLNIPIRNRAAQSDYVTSLLEIRQNELTLRKNVNQVRVDIQNAIIGLEQARARYEAAVESRRLQEETLAADQKKYQLGAATAFQVVQDQRDLATAVSNVTQAMANYTHARISLDQALGRTLEVNGVSLEEARTGKVARQSSAPAGGAQ